jgi:hypothetical protein
VDLLSGDDSRIRVIQLESPIQNKRSLDQRKKRVETVVNAIKKFDPLDVRGSLAKIVRASRHEDKKDAVPAVRRDRDGAVDDEEDPVDRRQVRV